VAKSLLANACRDIGLSAALQGRKVLGDSCHIDAIIPHGLM
jgi:hypothetical protein